MTNKTSHLRTAARKALSWCLNANPR